MKRPVQPIISRGRYLKIRAKHGVYASWATWAAPSGKPKSNMGCIDHFDDPCVINQLTNKVVMVALNFSRTISGTFVNFHDPNPRANDYKIRYAFMGTPYWGAYMTDIIKLHVEVESGKVLEYLRANPKVIKENLATFREELRDLGARRPVILAFGKATHRILSEGLASSEYSHLVPLTHYSHQISQVAYKADSLRRLRGIKI